MKNEGLVEIRKRKKTKRKLPLAAKVKGAKVEVNLKRKYFKIFPLLLCVYR